MKKNQQFKLNKWWVGALVTLLTVAYLFATTAFAQDETTKAGTGIDYNKDHLSYGDVWAFGDAERSASNYSKTSLGNSSYYSDSDNTKDAETSFTRYFYKEVTTTERGAPEGTTVPSHALARFYSGATQDEVSSPVDETLKIPVITTTNTNANTRYSVVPDTKGTYYVYVYSENDEPIVNYAMLDSPAASIAYNDASGVPETALEFEAVGNNWYKAPIEVTTVRWHAVALNNQKDKGTSDESSGVGTYTGGQDFDATLNGGGGGDTNTTYYYNQWSTTNVDYNTVIIFQFTRDVKLGPITKGGDTITITNPAPEKGDVTAHNIFGEEIEIGKEVTTPHAPIIISGEAKGDFKLDEVTLVEGNGQINASDGKYVYPFEETSVLSVAWTKDIDLPTITVTGGTTDVNMDFFAARNATIIHPAGEEKTYTFTVDFSNAPSVESLSYTYTFNGTEMGSGELTADKNSFSISNISYDIVVTFTATDPEDDTFTFPPATCNINLSEADANAPFRVGSDYFLTWEKAVTAAASASTKQVILNNDYTLPNSLAGNGMLENGTYVKEDNGRINYTLPAGVVFIIPHAADYTYVVGTGISDHTFAVETQNTGNGGTPTAVNTSVYLELTVPSGVSINLEASSSTAVANRSVLSVGATFNGSEVISGAHSNIHLMEGAEINIEKNAVLSSCGYTYGEGVVNAEDGGAIYMPFAMADFRGGGYTVGAAGRLSSGYGLKPLVGNNDGISPFIRYTMNSVQSKQIINPGAKVVGYINMNAGSEHHNVTATIIGLEEGLIQASRTTTIEITYDADTYASSYTTVGRTKIKIDGDATFGNLNMQLKIKYGSGLISITVDASIDTSEINFPIPYNYDIEIAKGTFTVPNSIMLLPGASVTVNKGATLNVSNSLTIYDGLHDYTSSGTSADAHLALKGWEKGSGSNPESSYSDTVSTYTPYPSTAALQGATFGGSGSADLIVNGTMNLQNGATIAGIIQTGGEEGATITTASNIGTSTATQIGLAGDYGVATQHSYFAGATVRTLTGEILDTATGERTKIAGGKTYYSSAGVGNISSYTYTLYYDSAKKSIELTDEVACILQGSWYNYEIPVHTVKDGEIIDSTTMYFADGAKVSDYYTDQDCTKKATTVNENTDALYFDADKAEAMIEWANGNKETYFMTVRNAVQAAVNEGDRIVLLQDLNDFSSVIGPMADQDFIFDMDHHEINYRSTPFTNNLGGEMTVEMNGGTITNVVNGKHYDSPVLSVKPGYNLTLLMNGGTISVTGDSNTALVNGGVENAGNLYIDLGGGSWEYKTGLVVPKSEAAANQHHDLTVMNAYQSKAMFNNTGTLTIKDTQGGATVTTDLISNGTTLTATTPTTNYVSVIRNNAGATLNLGGGKFILEPKGDVNGDPILSTAATPIPMVTYSAVVLNFGDIYTCEDGTALSMQGSGSHVLYNLKGGTADIDLRGGTIALVPYDKGVAANAAMYSGKAAVVNDGEMTLKSSAEDKGKILMNVPTSSGSLYGVLNSNNAAIFSTLMLDKINIELLNAPTTSSYGVYNRAGSTITGINNTDITMVLGQAVNSTGSATTTTTIGDIKNSSFTVGTTEAVAGSSAFYVSYTHVGNITGSKFKNEATASNTAAFRLDGSAAVWSTIGDITESYFEGGLNGLLAYNNVRIDIGNITNSHFSSGTGYALSAAGGSTIKSITGSSFTSAASGGLNLGGTGENTSTGVKRVLATVGGITDTKFNVTTIGINISHADIGNLDKVIIKTQTGNGITATNGSIIGDVTDCEITSGEFNEETGLFTTGGVAVSNDGAAATATANLLVGQIGNITGSVLKGRTGGISNTNGSIIGNITDTTIESDAYGINITSRAGNAYAEGAAPKIGNLIEVTIDAGTYGVQAAGAAAATANLTVDGETVPVYRKGVAPVIGDIVGTTINAGSFGMNIASAAANAYGDGVGAVVGKIDGCTVNAVTYGIQIAGGAGTAANDYEDIGFATVGDITGNTVNAGTSYGIYLSYANAGKIEDCTVSSAISANTSGVIHVTNRSFVEYIKDTNITVKDTSTNTGTAGIYTSASTIGDITLCHITASKGPAISHNATAALGVSTIGNIVECTIKSGAGGIAGASGQVTATAVGAAPVFGNIIDTTFDTVTYGISIAGSAATTNGNAVAPTVGNITGCTFNVGSYGISISGGAGVTAYPDHAFAKVGDITGTTVNAGTSYGIYLSYADAGKIEECTIEAAPTTNNYGVLYVTNRSSIEHIYDTDITVRDTSTNTSVVAIYTSASTIGDITLCEITSSKGPAISHNATAALGVSTIGDITDCTIVSGAGGIVGAGGAATATAKAAAPVIGNITKTTFDTVTYGVSIAGVAANTYGDAAFAKVGDITGTTVNSGTYSIYLNYCKGGVIEDCKLYAVNPAANSYVIGNANGSYIKHIKDTPITVTEPSGKSYGIYNNGGEIELIENSPIDAPYGIYNLNVRVTAHTTETGSTISYYGRIGTIKDMEVKVAQWALQNRGVINEIIGECTFIAANPSAQVPWHSGTIAAGTAAANTFVNYNTWWGSDGNSTIWKQTDTYDDDGNLTRTVEYKWDDEHRPTIGKISGDIKIIAENTSTNTAHGVAMINNGIIREISGNVDIETYVHPENTAITSSSYALQNTSGGQIDKIVGNVKISAGAYAIQNSTGQLYIKNAVTYNGETATSGQETDIERIYFHDYVGIGEITGANGDGDEGIIIEATAGSYAIENHARIGDITGKVSITANGGSYAIQNTTGTTINIIQTMTWPGADFETPKTYHQEYVMAEIGTIGGGDSEILISSNGATNNTYTLQSNGRIAAILEGVTIKDLTGYNNMPTIFNSEGSYTELDYTYKHLRYDESAGRYYTEVTRDYVYEQPYIGEIRGVNVSTKTNYALRNTGVIESITDSSFTAATGYGIDNTLSYAAADGSDYARETVQIYYGTTPLAVTTSHLGETTIWFNRDQATIGKIDNVDITVESGNYGIQNAGIIDSITNSEITVVSGTDAIGNTIQAATGEDVSMMDEYIYLNESGSYAATTAGNITDKVWTYELPTINSIGEGVKLTATAKTIENKGIIGEIGSEDGERTTITATSTAGTNQQAIFNYDGFSTEQKRDESVTSTYTYGNATIGTIKNVSISNGITPAIQNGNNGANYYPVIEEIGEGTEVHSIGGMAVSNYTNNAATNNAQIKKITGGIFTTEASGAFYALYNYSTVYPIELSGGFFKGGSEDRDHAIYQPDNEARYTYPEDDMALSKKPKDVTFANGDTGTDYYFITANAIYIVFDGNGATSGEMEDLKIKLTDDTPFNEILVTFEENAFTGPGLEFRFWSTDEFASTEGLEEDEIPDDALEDKWSGTLEKLAEILELDTEEFEPGYTITLYAIWYADASVYTIEWGDMDFVYTAPQFIWNAYDTMYVQTNPNEDGWIIGEEGTNKITVSASGKNGFTAKLKFSPLDEEYKTLNMIFTNEDNVELENDTFTILANGETNVYAMLDGKLSHSVNKKPVGTITIVLEETE